MDGFTMDDFDDTNNNIREVSEDEAELNQNDVIQCNITKGESLGQGQFGKTYKGTMGNRTVAIKEPFRVELEKKEIDMLRNVRHRNIVRFLGHCNIKKKFCLVMELADNGDLCTILHKKERRRFPLTNDLKDRWIREIACGLEYLHDGLDYSILHGDVKSPNVLIFKEPHYVAKLSDFGLSEEMLNGTYTLNEKVSFSARWAAPEAVRSKRTKMSDVWSYGALLWEILQEKLPHYSLTEEHSIIFAVGYGTSPYDPKKDTVPEIYKELLDKCFIYEHKHRWEFKAIIRYIDDYKNPLESDGDTIGPQECVSELRTQDDFYRRATYEFSVKMKDEELLKKVKYLFREEIPRGIRDRIKDGMDMVDKLETSGLLSSGDMEGVAGRLSSVGEVELANIFREGCSVDKNGCEEVKMKSSDYCDAKDTSCRSSDMGNRRGSMRSFVVGNADEEAGKMGDFTLNFSQPVDEIREVRQPRESPMDLSDVSECEKAMYANEENTRQIDSFVTSLSTLEHSFDIVSEHLTKNNFRVLARHLLGFGECASELETITRQTQNQRYKTLSLLDLWYQRQKKKGIKPTCEDLVAALRASNLQRTASLVEEKSMPYP